jgi:hypothetical protein
VRALSSGRPAESSKHDRHNQHPQRRPTERAARGVCGGWFKFATLRMKVFTLWRCVPRPIRLPGFPKIRFDRTVFEPCGLSLSKSVFSVRPPHKRIPPPRHDMTVGQERPGKERPGPSDDNSLFARQVTLIQPLKKRDAIPVNNCCLAGGADTIYTAIDAFFDRRPTVVEPVHLNRRARLRNGGLLVGGVDASCAVMHSIKNHKNLALNTSRHRSGGTDGRTGGGGGVSLARPFDTASTTTTTWRAAADSAREIGCVRGSAGGSSARTT